MGLRQSPSIVTSGLIFALDAGNDKSYKGPPVTNLLNQITNNNSSGAGKSITSGTQEISVPQLGPLTVKFSSIQNDYPAVSTDCCPSPFAFSGGFTAIPSTLYTYGIVYKVDSGYTHPNYMYRYEYTSSSGTYVTEGGVHNNSNRIHLGDGWYWAWGTFTTQATTNWMGYCGAFYYRYTTLTDKLYVAKVFMAQGDYTQLHPKYWPDVNTARTNTQAVTDLISNATITASNLSYASNGSISYNGTSSYLTFSRPNSITTNGPLSLSLWARWTTVGTTTSTIQVLVDNNHSASPNQGFVLQDRPDLSKSLTFSVSPSQSTVQSTFQVGDGNWHHIVATNDLSLSKLYIDGSLNAQVSEVGLVSAQPNVSIGYWQFGNSRFLNGSLPHFSMYNRALTANEVKQNFNALRGRFGI